MGQRGTDNPEIDRVSVVLTRLAEDLRQMPPTVHLPRSLSLPVEPGTQAASMPINGIHRAEALFADRQRREWMLKDWSASLREPGWDIVVYLYIGYKKSWEITVSHACRMSGASATTALRCIARLDAMNIVSRTQDSGDRRRSMIRLEQTAAERLDRFFAAGSVRASA